MFIPTIGTQFTLSRKWTFRLIHENRNRKLEEFFGLREDHLREDFKFRRNISELYRRVHNDPGRLRRALIAKNPPEELTQDQVNLLRARETAMFCLPASTPVTLKKGTILVVDRVYIRQQMPDYDSVSFKIPKNDENIALGYPHNGHPIRFFASLEDVNKIKEKDVVNPTPNYKKIPMNEMFDDAGNVKQEHIDRMFPPQ